MVIGMKKIILILLSFWAVELCAQIKYQRSYNYPVLNQKTQFYLNPDFLPITITNVKILKNAAKGNLSVDSNTFLNYSTTLYSTKDSCHIEISYDDFNSRSYKDTFTLILQILGKANTYANFYHTGKILTKQFYSAVYSDSMIIGQKWDFGDSKSSGDQNPTHTYLKGGNYKVCLTAYSKIDTSTFCESILVNDTDYVELTDDYYTVYFPDTAVSFNILENDFQYKGSLSLVTNGKYNSGEVKNNKFYITSTKIAPRTYDTLSYRVCKNGKCDTASVYVYQFINYSQLPCLADFTYQVSKKTVNLISEPVCKNGKGAIRSLKWRIDTLVIGTNDSLNYVFKDYGFYNVCLDVLDTFGLVNTSCKGVGLYDNGCYPQFSYFGKANEIRFFNETFCFDFPNDSTKSYLWDFGDGNSKSGFDVKHIYKKAGNYNVCLGRITATDTFKTCNTIIVYDSSSLIANDDFFVVATSQNPSNYNILDNDIALLARSVTVIDSTKLGKISITNDGHLTYLRPNKYTYGTDSFTYVVCSKSKCDTAIGILQSGFYFINPTFECTPEISYSVTNNKVDLTAGSKCVNSKEGAYLWYFDDGTTDTSRVITRTYQYPGYKDIRLLMVDTAGNWSFTYEMILIIDSALNNGCVFAQDDYFTVNNFYNTGSNIIHNDYNLNFKHSRTIAYTDFKHGITLLDSFGNLNWVPDSAYKGCDTMSYIVFDLKNKSCADTAVVMICYEDLSAFCIDSSIIDTTVDCNYGYMPVCGCDNKEYDNFCDAYYKGGVSFYFHGPCTNLPPRFSLNGSSSMKKYTIYNNEVSSMSIQAIDPNEGNTISMTTKLDEQFNPCLKTELKNGKIFYYPSSGCTGNYTLYLSACDNWGYCSIDTLKITVLNKSTSGIQLNKGEGFKVYPNPTSTILNLQFSTINSGDYLKIYDITGKQVGDKIAITNLNETLNLEELKAGLYYIQHLTGSDEILSIAKVSKL